MRAKINKGKIANIKASYCAFFGVYILAFIFGSSDLKTFGLIGSGVGLGGYLLYFFIGYKLLKQKRLLLIGNICFVLFNIVTVLYAFNDNNDSIVGLLFAIASVLLFLIISNKTLGVVLEHDEQLERELSI